MSAASATATAAVTALAIWVAVVDVGADVGWGAGAAGALTPIGKATIGPRLMMARSFLHPSAALIKFWSSLSPTDGLRNLGAIRSF
jgi:hypothetical protein